MMANVLALTGDMSREEWLGLRRRGIGGSDAAAVAGLSPWRSALDIFYDKINEFPVQEIEESEKLYWGTILESVVADEFSRRTGLKIRRRNAILQHSEYPFMIGDIDRLIIDKERGNGVLEVKTTSEFMAKEWEDDLVPDHYYVQLQHYLAVTGLTYGYFAVLIGGQRLVIKRVNRDEEVIQSLIKIESDFWKLVEERRPPDVDGSEAARKALQALFPKSNEKTVKLPDEASQWIKMYEDSAREEKAARERKEKAANHLKMMLQENEVGVIGERKVTWKTVVSRQLDRKALKAEMPDIYDRYNKPVETRRFQIF